MNFILIILMGVIVFFAFKKAVLLGVLALILCIAYAIYLLMPNIIAARGQNAFQKGDYENAKKYSEKAYKRMNFNQRVSYAYMLVQMDEPERAIDILNSYIKLSGLGAKEKNVAKRQRCLAYYMLGRYREALLDAKEIYEAGYTTKNLMGLMGMLMLVLGIDLDKTTKFCEEAYDYDEDDRDIQDNVSICYYLQGDYEMAWEINGYVREENPEFIEGYYHGAQIAVAKGEYNVAKELLDKIPDCKRSDMTTISEDAVRELSDMVSDLLSNRITEPKKTPVFTLKEEVMPEEEIYIFKDDEEDSESIYDEYNALLDEEDSESIYDELNALESKNKEDEE